MPDVNLAPAASAHGKNPETGLRTAISRAPIEKKEGPLHEGAFRCYDHGLESPPEARPPPNGACRQNLCILNREDGDKLDLSEMVLQQHRGFLYLPKCIGMSLSRDYVWALGFGVSRGVDGEHLLRLCAMGSILRRAKSSTQCQT